MKRIERKPTFLWQGVLILAPVAVLACVGIIAARNDRQAVRHEAEQQAGEFAERVTTEVWAALWNGTNATLRIEVGPEGRLLKPALFHENPAPRSFDHAALSPEQRTIWLSLQSEADTSELAQKLNTFEAAAPPGDFAAAAHLRLGHQLMGIRDYSGAAAHFAAATNVAPNALAESGLPLCVLARIHLRTSQERAGMLSDTEKQASTSAVLAMAIEHPSALTPELLRRAATEGSVPPGILKPLQRRWELDEQARRIYRKLQSSHQGAMLMSLSSSRVPAAFEQTDRTVAWIAWTNVIERSNGLSSSPIKWCVVRVPATNGATLLCHQVDMVESVVTDAVTRLKLPRFLGVSMTIAGSSVVDPRNMEGWDYASGGRGGGHYLRRTRRTEIPEILGNFAQMAGGESVVSAGVHLVSPDLLYARQNQRVIWLGLVIGAAALTAVIGFIAAYRAFARQLCLAEMKSNFVSSVSHELRAPIASVRLMAEGLERGAVSEPAKQHQYFRFIVQECRRLSSMIENVLDFARIDQGRKRYVLEPTNLRTVLDQTIALMQPHAIERGVTLRLATPAESEWTAMADGHAIQQALVNLIDNAIKHSSAGQEVAVELVKPFSTDELLARVRALLRRTRTDHRSKAAERLLLGDVEIDLLKQTAQRGRKPIHLTAREIAILRLLAEADGEPVSRERFLDVAWGYNSFPTTRTVDMHIAALRRKIEKNPEEPRWIETVHGVGYRLSVQFTKP